jgi:hypothetical protein
MTSRSHTVALKDHWSGPTVSTQFDSRLLLRLLSAALLLKQIGILVVLFVTGHFDGTMFTYWQYLGITPFYAILAAALWIERGLLTFTMMFLLPLFLGSTMLVAVAIVLIIQQNSAIFTSGGGPDVALSLIHTGDWILHQLPLVEIQFLLGGGLHMYARLIIAAGMSQMQTGEGRAAYVLYFVMVPLIPFAVYCSIFDAEQHYPTGIPIYWLWFGLVAFNIIWMAYWLCAFTSSAQVQIRYYRFFGKTVNLASTTNLISTPEPERFSNPLLQRTELPEMVVGGDYEEDTQPFKGIYN